MYKHIKTITSVSLLALLAACGNNNAKNAGAAGMQAAPVFPVVTGAVVSSDNATYYDDYPGTVTALKDVTLTSQVNGYVTSINFKDGQNISAGELLYVIDQEVYQANVANAQANVAALEANLVKAQKDADNYHKLDEQNAIAKQQVYYADAALENAKKQVAAAKAQTQAVQANLKFSRIYAPFNGTIGISQVRVGTAVVAGQTVLNSVSTNDPMAVDFNVDQADLYRFEKLLNSQDVNDSTFSIAFGTDIYPSYGRISLIDRAVDPQTGTIKIRLSFPNAKNMLKPGMQGTVRVLHRADEQTLLVPSTCVVEQLGEFNVFVVTDSSTVKQQHVSLGETIGSNIIVKNGLTAGQKIVIVGQQNLHDGSKITTDTSSHKKN